MNHVPEGQVKIVGGQVVFIFRLPIRQVEISGQFLTLLELSLVNSIMFSSFAQLAYHKYHLPLMCKQYILVTEAILKTANTQSCQHYLLTHSTCIISEAPV